MQFVGYSLMVLVSCAAAYYFAGWVLAGISFGLDREHGERSMLLVAVIALLLMTVVSGGSCFYLWLVANQPVWAGFAGFAILASCGLRWKRLYDS